MVRRPGPGFSPTGEQPFFTRRSVLLWAAVFVVSGLVSGEIAHVRGALGLVGALAVAASGVSLVVTWVGGLVLALRLGSLLLLLSVVLFGPLGSVLVAIVSPPAPRPPARRK